MANGAKFMQDGNDVTRGADHEVTFSTEWQNLRVAHSVLNTYSVRIKDGEVVNPAMFKHGLDYAPLFIPFRYTPSGKRFGLERAVISGDDQAIYYVLPGGSMPNDGIYDITLGLQVFAVDIKEPYEAPTDSPIANTTGSGSGKYGIQFVSEGDVSNALKKDFLVDTKTKSPQLHAVATGYPGNFDDSGFYYKFEYQHDLPYNPMYFAYIEDIFDDRAGKMLLVNNTAGVKVQGKTITITGLLANQLVSIVILKSPFEGNDNHTVVTI